MRNILESEHKRVAHVVQCRGIVFSDQGLSRICHFLLIVSSCKLKVWQCSTALPGSSEVCLWAGQRATRGQVRSSSPKGLKLNSWKKSSTFSVCCKDSFWIEDFLLVQRSFPTGPACYKAHVCFIWIRIVLDTHVLFDSQRNALSRIQFSTECSKGGANGY